MTLARYACLLAAAACAGTSRPAPQAGLHPVAPREPVAVEAGSYDPRSAGGIVFLSVELPDPGVVIGGHYEGVQYDRLRSTMQMAPGAREHWMDLARVSGDSALAAAGFVTRPVTAPAGEAEALRNLRFGLAARVTAMDLKTTGYVEPFVIDASVRVEWDLLDFASGAAVFEGRSSARVRGADSLGAAVAGSVAAAVARLLEQPKFQRAVMTPRPLMMEDLLVAEFARRMPEPWDTVRLDPAAQYLSASGGTMAGVALLNGSRGYRATALVLTRDGLALAPGSVGRQRWLWALHADGRRRAARIVRVSGDVALVELSCPDPCATVPWTLDSTLEDGARVVWYGGGALSVTAIAAGLGYGERTLRVRRPRSGPATWSLKGRRRLQSGEAIARTPDGLMVGVATPAGVLPLTDVFRQLRLAVVER